MDFIHKYEAFKGQLVEACTLVMEGDEPVSFVGTVNPVQLNPASLHLLGAVRVDQLEDIIVDDSDNENEHLKMVLATKGEGHILSTEHVWGMRSIDQKTVGDYKTEKDW
ncbi:hypothetical protein HZA97_10080 [Candidatus Woesearchaeota archaeon]|nr:hypothetical protein [Candidatus Woesearchaeota archaeon]